MMKRLSFTKKIEKAYIKLIAKINRYEKELKK